MNKKKIIIVISAIAALLLGFGIYKGVTYIKSYNQLKEINEDNKENETIKEKATIKEVTSENVTEDDKNKVTYNGKNYSVDNESFYSYQSAYRALLLIEQSTKSNIHYYFLDDIDNSNGVPELIIVRGNTENELELCIYSYDDVEHTQYLVGCYIAPYAQVYDRANMPGLAIIATYGDKEDIKDLTIKNHVLTEVTTDDPQEAIKYYKGTEKIATYQVDDYTPLETENNNKKFEDVIAVNAANATYRECYSLQLQYEKYNKNNRIACYYVYDMDSNGIPELIVVKGKSGDTMHTYVYSYDDILHTSYFVGEYFTPLGNIYSTYNKEGITVHSSLHGIETYTDLKIQNKLLINNTCEDIENFKRHKAETELKMYDIDTLYPFEY